MTVAELIEKLKKCDQSAEVWVQSESMEYGPNQLECVCEEKGSRLANSPLDNIVVLSERP